MKQIIPDYTGQKVDMLTVLEKVYVGKGKGTHYKCLCDCGKVCIRRAYGLYTKTKNPHSCGCAVKSDKPSERRIDMLGQRYGKLVVTKMMYDYNKNHETFCECVCDCGNTVIKNAAGLRNRKPAYPPNCGCMNSINRLDQSVKLREDLTGRRFGRLTVIKMNFQTNCKTTAECVCDCGNTIITKATYLKNGDTQSCGCYQKDATSNANTKDFTGTKSDAGVEILRRHSQTDRGVWLWECKCGDCGTTFVALPANVINNHITSCGCNKRSSGERIIGEILKSCNIQYVSEKRFDDCADIRSLPFDFYLPDYNVAIEYQGVQHYIPIERFGGLDSFAKQLYHDRIKQAYCEDNNINLILIYYDETPDEIRDKITSIIYPERLSRCAQ